MNRSVINQMVFSAYPPIWVIIALLFVIVGVYYLKTTRPEEI